jgi:hypothetical protein
LYIYIPIFVRIHVVWQKIVVFILFVPLM